jgi:menaquinone-dependent protoporphyrinogen oxidase
MIDVPVFYATTEGQTARIAEFLAASLRQVGLESEALAVASREAAGLDWSRIRGTLLGASVHFGKHQRAAAVFARAHRVALNAHPSAFFSVSLSAASSNPDERVAARAIAQRFTEVAHWRPSEIACLAGALAYRKYGWLKRMIMRRIARKEGGPTDTSQDHELTNWDDVERLAGDMAARIQASVVQPGGSRGRITHERSDAHEARGGIPISRTRR